MLMKLPLSSFPGGKCHTERRSQPPEVADFVNLPVVVSLRKPIEVHLTPTRNGDTNQKKVLSSWVLGKS
jgi:hypothetical protein